MNLKQLITRAKYTGIGKSYMTIESCITGKLNAIKDRLIELYQENKYLKIKLPSFCFAVLVKTNNPNIN